MSNDLKWKTLLDEAINNPGQLEACFKMFHNYSLGNQLAAMFQCKLRGIDEGPMKTFNGWKELGRMVKKGEKALALCQPFTGKDKNDPEKIFTYFVWKPRWFVLSQTEGREYEWDKMTPVWDKEKALSNLGIVEETFREMNGNTQGYATPNNTIAINPLAQRPVSVLHHELAHIVLGHTKHLTMFDTDKIDRSTMEVEAESVALLLLDTLGLPGAEYARGYIQHWNKTDEINEKMAQRIIKTADTILKAGLPNRVTKE